MKRIVNLKEEVEIVQALQRVADAEGTSLAAVYRRAVRLFLSTLPTNGKNPKDADRVAA